MSQICPNCNTTLPVEAKFCSNCGQSFKNYRRPLLAFLKDALHEILDIDGRLWRTTKTLLFRPGLASYEFDQGKRAKYTPPLRVYLVTSLIFFLVFASFQQIYVRDATVTSSTTELYSRAMFVLFPLFALYAKCFFWHSYYVSNLVFSMHIHSVAYVVLMVTGPLEAMETRSEIFVVLQVLPATYFVWYMLQGFRTMFRQTWPITVIKALGVYMVYMGTFGIVFDFVLA